MIYPALYSVRCRKIGTRDWRPGILLNAYRVKRFLCAKHGYAQIMVGCVRASSEAPGLSSRLRQPYTVHHQSIGVVGGDG